jgi:hypothetical protein
MANPTVEKLQQVGLRYGDKVAVALASVVFVLCLALAISRKSVDITPDQVKKAAEAAETNINRRQDPSEIVAILEQNGIKNTNFARAVEDASKTVLIADNYAPERPWVTPEPGAGLIRDTPVLIAPGELFAYAGRGGALMYDLDEKGERIVDTEAKEPPKEEPRRGRRRRGGMTSGYGPMMGGYGGMMGGRGSRRSQSEIEREEREELERRKREMAAKLAGPDQQADEKEEQAKEELAAPNVRYKESVKGLRWVAITGTLDHGKILANYRTALKNPAVAHPHYARLDLQRKFRQRDGSWSDWEDVNADENLTILDNLPEEDEELTPESVRPENLVDPLPFLSAGLWEKVHIASLVPKERKEIETTPPPMGGMMMMGGGKEGGRMGGPASYQSMMMRGGGGMSGYPGMMRGGSGMSGYPGMMRGGSGMMTGGYGGMMRGGSGMMTGGYGGMMRGGRMGDDEGMGGYGGMMGGGEIGSFWKSEEKRVMIRALDFTARPDTEYRYRVRVVVFNPNRNREDVSPGVDTKSTELYGPWSDPTNEVYMPADVTPYAMGTLPPSGKSDIKVKFQVVRFDPTTGWTVPRNFEASAGEVVGEIRTADIPSAEGTGKKSIPVDFNTREIVLDGSGGMQPLPPAFPGGAIERPTIALLLRPDGGVETHLQYDDVANEFRKDIERNYARELKDSNKKRENSMGSGYGGMMGGYGGMMGGYGGMMMQGGRR